MLLITTALHKNIKLNISYKYPKYQHRSKLRLSRVCRCQSNSLATLARNQSDRRRLRSPKVLRNNWSTGESSDLGWTWLIYRKLPKLNPEKFTTCTNKFSLLSIIPFQWKTELNCLSEILSASFCRTCSDPKDGTSQASYIIWMKILPHCTQLRLRDKIFKSCLSEFLSAMFCWTCSDPKDGTSEAIAGYR